MAGISTWVLTGDKEETAINVGFAAGMINNDTHRLMVTSSNSSKLLTQLKECKEVQLKLKKTTEDSCVIVSGDSLPIVL